MTIASSDTALQRLLDRAVDRRPMRPGRAIMGARAFGDMDRALGQADVAVDRGDHLGDRDRSRPPRQAVAARGPPRRRCQPGMGQRLQHLGDRRPRQPGFGGDRCGGDLPPGVGGEMGGDDDAVIGELAQDDHRSGPIRSLGPIRSPGPIRSSGQFVPDWYAIHRPPGRSGQAQKLAPANSAATRPAPGDRLAALARPGLGHHVIASRSAVA